MQYQGSPEKQWLSIGSAIVHSFLKCMRSKLEAAFVPLKLIARCAS